MRRHAPLSLALLGAAMAVPGSARAWQDPSPSSPAAMVIRPSTAPVPLDHKHFGRIKMGLIPCEKCEAARRAGKVYQAYPPAGPVTISPDGGHQHVQAPSSPMGLPPGSQIVACAHSSNGVCPSCRTLLEMPGQVTMMAPGTPVAAPGVVVVAAPGRALASDSAPGHAVAEAAEPEPIGLMRTNYSQPGSQVAARPGAPQPAMPAGAGSTPFMSQADEHDPHVLTHLFGISAWQRDIRDRMESRSRRKRDAHAAISYDASSEKPTNLPASAVYGPGGNPR